MPSTSAEVAGRRAVAVVQRGRTVLVMKRFWQGRDYAVLPGGSVDFVMTDVEGTPSLSGPELEDHSPDNSFELIWAGADDLHGLGLHPEHLSADLPRLLGL